MKKEICSHLLAWSKQEIQTEKTNQPQRARRALRSTDNEKQNKPLCLSVFSMVKNNV